MESELFGYKRGAFTGAMRTRHGRFELCDKGTILLDEIAELPAALQAKLLHVLQDKQFFRLGRHATVTVDVRILAATNVNIQKALAEKRLREDLYYRLSAFTLQVPPLRDRKEEIPLLLGHFMNRMARRYGLVPRPLPAILLDACQNYSWPGNLRELENVVKRYLVMGNESLELGEPRPKSGGHISDGQVEDVTWHQAGDAAIPANENDNQENLVSLKNLVRSIKGETEKCAISNTLEKTRWNRKEAARLLGISYRGLLYKIEQYQLTRPPLGEFAEK